MSAVERHLRADAERNRRKLLAAAAEEFRRGGLDVCIADIAARAGVGRGTVFRNFPTKNDLIAAVVVESMRETAARGRAAVDQPDARGALFSFLEEIAGRQQRDRALAEAIGDTFLANDEIRSALGEVVAALDALLRRAQERGAVRADVGALDLLMMLKGVCEASGAFSHIDPDIAVRQLDLVRAALKPSGAEEPLRGRPTTLADVEQIFAQGGR